MQRKPAISAAAASRDRCGMNHISRLIELYMTQLQWASATATVKSTRSNGISFQPAGDPSSLRERENHSGPQLSKATSAANTAKRKPALTRADEAESLELPLTAKRPAQTAPIISQPVQTTFAFYQGSE